ncbi:GTPase-associated system all-helical protein GASH [Iodobacter fluviatilis]|uniref:GTPase-associated system helical domain-containing protein n=1 Tax=Iodobacter fluviatilis TaxID=537 RepID=A0A377STT1_9NEIS|nr:GTPase-associated system all-helical protein GASH [Iodobacter fluviatilis]TCU81615.1 hypothetical protein EV682_12015 [Iodobacter fluviatilis]STR44785.1 Uncharacterised protein [Iodobacter fluviatilis]
MTISVLQDFLNLRLLDIGAEDSRLEKLSEACNELSQQYMVEPNAAMTPLLTAWDPTAGPEPALIAIGELLQKYWPTFRGAFQDEPLTLYRAIVLEAVMQAMDRQGVLAVAVDLVGANVLPYLNVGKEERILSKILERARDIKSERLTQLWRIQTASEPISPLKISSTPALKNLDPNVWFSQVAAAAGPNTDKAGVTLETPNPYWPSQPTNWSYEFANRMAPLLADVHDKAVNAALKASTQVFKGLGESIATKLNDFFRSEQLRKNQLNISNNLLWWRQSLYSETAAMPYRKLDSLLVPLHMAIDMANLLPEVYPPAVESLLFEAVLAAIGSRGEEEISMGELMDAHKRSITIEGIARVKGLRITLGNRSLFIQSIANFCIHAKLDIPQLDFDSKTSMTLGDWAIWFLREIKALDALFLPDEIEQLEEQA